MSGYVGKILTVDLNALSFDVEELNGDMARRYLGGSSLATRLLAGMDWQRDSYDPETDLIFATGPITGTSAPASARYVVCSKSPLTSGWGEAHASGYWGPELKYAGFDAIIIKGKAERPVYLLINDQAVQLKSAEHLAGRDTYQTETMLRNELKDKKTRVLCIGPAGEKMSRIAAIINDHGRAAARGGIAAVMGSKNLKAIAVRGHGKLKMADESGFRALSKSLHKMISESPARAALHSHGTNVGMEAFYTKGDVPIKNWAQGAWDENIKNLYGPEVTRRILAGTSSCRACPIGCGRIIEVKEGEYAGLAGKGPEYETIAAFGSLCLNDNIEAIAKANDLCNRYGLDTISTGAAVAMAMECYDRGLLTSKDLDGLELTWGNHRAIVSLVEKIGCREGIGDLLAEGTLRAAEKIGKGAEEAAIHVKGLELPMHDPRGFNSWAVSYPTVPRGGCHIAAPTYWLERGVTFPNLGFPEQLDPHSPENKGQWTAVFQDFCEVLESMVTCKFSLYGGVRSNHVVEMISLCTGWDMDLQEMLKIGERANNIKRLINLKLGFGIKDDSLPERIRSLSLQTGGTDGYLPVPDMDIMLADYYRFRGWSEDGVPSREKFDELDLSDALGEAYRALLAV
jgi:aldehyde:ferredoxin oxidoreductase